MRKGPLTETKMWVKNKLVTHPIILRTRTTPYLRPLSGTPSPWTGHSIERMRRGNAKGRLNTEDGEYDGWRQYIPAGRGPMATKRPPNNLSKIHYRECNLIQLVGIVEEFKYRLNGTFSLTSFPLMPQLP